MNFESVVKATVVVLGLVAVAGFGAQQAAADSSGLDAIHAKIRVGGRTCFDGHSHSGSGAGPTRRAAEEAAIRSWADFTITEYGTDWGHYGKTINKSMRCSQSAAGWSCDLEATPCR